MLAFVLRECVNSCDFFQTKLSMWKKLGIFAWKQAKLQQRLLVGLALWCQLAKRIEILCSKRCIKRIK